MSQNLCGKTAANAILESIGRSYKSVLATNPQFIPCLDIIKANNREDTNIYIAKKLDTMKRLGFKARLHSFHKSESAKLRYKILELNEDSNCHGILVQYPIELGEYRQHMADHVSSLIEPKKDVDGLNPANLGKLASRSVPPDFYPCTPLGIIKLCGFYKIELSGRRIAVLGRSEIVGLPLFLMLTRMDATVTLCHSKTINLPSIIRESDMVIAAIGKPGFVKSDWICPGTVVIDVGINRITNITGHNQIVGDVDPKVSSIAGALTPVPGGVGPMTIAMLVHNLFISALNYNRIPINIDR